MPPVGHLDLRPLASPFLALTDEDFRRGYTTRPPPKPADDTQSTAPVTNEPLDDDAPIRPKRRGLRWLAIGLAAINVVAIAFAIGTRIGARQATAAAAPLPERPYLATPVAAPTPAISANSVTPTTPPAPAVTPNVQPRPAAPLSPQPFAPKLARPAVATASASAKAATPPPAVQGEDYGVTSAGF